MNNQEAFDKMVEHLAQQKEPAIEHSFLSTGAPWKNCKYRAPDGKKCAVGALIPDELYDVKMESGGITYLMENWETLQEFFQGVDVGLLSTAQNIHDNIFPSFWEERFLQVGNYYNLNTEKVKLLHGL